MRNVRRFLSRWQNLLALLIVALYAAVAIAAPRLAPPDDLEHPSPFRAAEALVGVPRNNPLPPRPDLPLGATPGRLDVLYTLIWGTRAALRFGLIVALLAATIGVLIGATSVYIGGPVSQLVTRITDAFLTFPAIAGVALFRLLLYPAAPTEPPTPLQRSLLDLGLEPLMLALILFSWMPYARIIGAEVLKLKEAEYVQAAQSVGAGHGRIILRHLLPNAISPAIVLAARDIGGMVMLQAAFSFIGVDGGSPWGVLLANGRAWIISPSGNLLEYWWVYLPATVTLVFFGIGWNLLGDGLNNLLNPHTVHRKLW